MTLRVEPHVRPPRQTGRGTRMRDAAENGTLQPLVEQALREAFADQGGRAEKLQVTLEPNQDKRRPQPGERPAGYGWILKLHFDAAPGEYEIPHDEAVHAFAETIRRAWGQQQTDHAPGHYYAPEKQANGDFDVAVTHLDAAHLSNMVNRVLRAAALPTLNDRLNMGCEIARGR